MMKDRLYDKSDGAKLLKHLHDGIRRLMQEMDDLLDGSSSIDQGEYLPMVTRGERVHWHKFSFLSPLGNTPKLVAPENGGWRRFNRPLHAPALLRRWKGGQRCAWEARLLIETPFQLSLCGQPAKRLIIAQRDLAVGFFA